MSFSFIDKAAPYTAALTRWQHADVLAIDTEFVRERTLHAQFGLLQVNDGLRVDLVDPLAVTDLQPLWDTLAAHSGVQVLHSLGEDVELFWQQGQCLLPKPFDTQVAAAFLDLGQGIGFGPLVEQQCGVSLGKAHARTNWLRRPLTAEQLQYAAEDVIYLLPLYEKLSSQLEQRQLTEIVLAESQRLAFREPVAVEERYRDVKHAWTLNRQALNVLRTLAQWRYCEAAERDLATSFVVKDEALIALAEACPQNQAELKRLNALHPQERRIHGEKLLALIAEAQQIPEAQWPQRIYRVIDIPDYKKRQQQVLKLVNQCADELNVPASVIASKRMVGHYLMWQWRLAEGETLPTKPALLQSWRKERLGDKLAALTL